MGGEGETEPQDEREYGPEEEHRQLRRGGMPALIFTERPGDLFTHISMPSADAELLAVTVLRNDRLRELGATEPLQDAVMPLDEAREVVRKIKKRWQAEPAQRRKAVELQDIGLNEDAAHRTMSSNFPVAI